MDDDFFEHLIAAQTPEEGVKNSLNRLPAGLSDAAWASAVPHWFDEPVLAALLPHLADQAGALIDRLKKLAYVEPSQERGFIVHERTRIIILAWWWRERREEYRRLSARAQAYFAGQADDAAQVEAAYHALVSAQAVPSEITGLWSQVASRLKNSRQFILVHSLVKNAREHIAANRVPGSLAQVLSQWERSFVGEMETMAKERREENDLAGEVELFIYTRFFYMDLGDRLAEANTLVKLGSVYSGLKLYEEAGESLVQALDIYRSLVKSVEAAKTCADLGEVYWARKQPERALVSYENGLQMNPSSAECLVGRGDLYRDQKQYDAALADFNRAVELNPKLSWVISKRGLFFFHRRQYEAALADFHHAVELDSMNGLVYALRGDTYRLMGQYQPALADLDRAVALNPRNTAAIGTRGKTYRSLKQYEAALADFNRAIELDPALAWVFADRGKTYQFLKQYEAALADFDRAIELNPKNSWAIANRGETRRLLKQYQEAVADFSRAVELNPGYAWAFARRGQVYQALNQNHAALADFNRAVELNLTEGWVFAGRGNTHRLLKQYEAALADFNRALEIDRVAWYLYGRALVYFLANEPERAKADLSLATDLALDRYHKDPQNWQNTFNLALYFLAAGNDAEAGRLYQEALALKATRGFIQAAVIDLEDFLQVFPDHAAAQPLRRLLSDALRP